MTDADPHQKIKRLETEIERLKEQATRDPLTGLLNRRGFDDALEPLVKEVARYLKDPAGSKRQSVIIRALSLLFFDLDNFKPINDNHGHAAGDSTLKVVAGILTQETRSIDLVSRWGGDEFGVALIGAPLDEALKIAEKLKTAIENSRLAFDGKPHKLTVSVGASSLEADMNSANLFKAADQTLYQAKRSGKSRISTLD